MGIMKEIETTEQLMNIITDILDNDLIDDTRLNGTLHYRLREDVNIYYTGLVYECSERGDILCVVKCLNNKQVATTHMNLKWYLSIRKDMVIIPKRHLEMMEL
jgi:hypothetical protein